MAQSAFFGYILRRGCILASLLLVAAAVSGCESMPRVMSVSVDLPAGMPADQIFDYGHSLYESGDFARSGVVFSELERRYPYSQWGREAVILAAESYYEAGDYVRAEQSAKRYISFYPEGGQVDHALYLIGLSYRKQLPGVDRDQSGAHQVLEAFGELIRAYPDSPYAREAAGMLDDMYDRLALREMDVANYYLGRSDYVAALNRFRAVAFYPRGSIYVPDALARMVEIYVAMGILTESEKVGDFLCSRYPESSQCVSARRLLWQHGVGASSPPLPSDGVGHADAGNGP